MNKLFIRGDSSQNIYEMLIDQSVDLGLSTVLFSAPILKCEQLTKEPLVSVVGKDFANERDLLPLTESDDFRVPFINARLHNAEYQPWNKMHESITNNPHLTTIIETNSMEIAKQLVIEGLGAAIFPLTEVREEL
ncbi:MAG: substrate-binding domain-containing protein, partial [Gracilibacteraceae bacterium]|nr:substrate-binding domain-containing protein [Gracilibacteraceae bacterium]